MAEDKNNKEWKPLQALKEGFILNEIINPEFLNAVKAEFGTENVNAINLALFINTEKDEESDEKKMVKEAELISISHKTTEDTKNKRIIVDVRNTDSFNKIISAFDKI